jgi:hypothetical protein
MAFACHATTTLAEKSEEVISYMANESSPTDNNWVLSEESTKKDEHHEVRSYNEPSIESNAQLDTGTKQKDEDPFDSFEHQTEPGIRTHLEETDETAPRIQQVDTPEPTEDYAAGADDDAAEDEGGGRQFESSVEEDSETDKGSVPEMGKLSTDHASVITNTLSEFDGDKNGADANRPSDNDEMPNSFELEQFLMSAETDGAFDKSKTPDTKSAELESETSGEEAFLVGNSLNYDHASTFHGDEESDGSTQRLEVNDTKNTELPSFGPGHDEIPDREADLYSDDDVFNTETGPLLNERVDVGSTAESVESTASTVDGKVEANNSMKHEIYKTIGAMNATHKSTLAHSSAGESEEIGASLDIESGTPEAALEESGKEFTIITVNATHGSTLTNTSADESDKAKVSVDAQSATTEDFAEELGQDSTHEKVPPATNGTGSDKIVSSFYGDDDVIDFDAMDATHYPTLTNTSADESDEATASLDTQSATPKDSAEESVHDSTHERSLPTTNEMGSDENLASADLEGVASEKATENSGQNNSENNGAPKKGSLAEFFKKVSKGDEQFGKVAPTLLGAAPSKKSATANVIRRKEPVVETAIPLPLEEKKSSSLDEGDVNETAKYTGAWGSRKHSTSSSSRVPDDALRQLLLNIQETKDVEVDDTLEAENDALSDESSEDDGERVDEMEIKNTISYTANDGENAAETTDEKQRQAPASDFAAGDDENAVKVQKSVNTEFVDGLDDIDKFLEEVDPPDELDVGAAGSSIQEVLIGQSVQIVIKRAKLGFVFVSKFVRQKVAEGKVQFDEFVSQRTNQDGDFALFTRKEVDAVAEKLIRIGRRVLKGVQDLLNDLFGDDLDEDLLSLDLDLDKIQAKIVSLRKKETLPRPGNIASTKESVDADANVQ